MHFWLFCVYVNVYIYIYIQYLGYLRVLAQKHNVGQAACASRLSHIAFVLGRYPWVK